MKTRSFIRLFKVEKVKIDDVTKNKITETLDLRATEERIFASRQLQYEIEKINISRRLRIRQFNTNVDEVKKYYTYAQYKDLNYKVKSITEDVNDHYYIIELGEIITSIKDV